MTQYDRALIRGFRVAGAACVIALLQTSEAAAQPNRDVNVVNQPTVHLAPLTSVAITGTPTVTIGGTPSVAISGTPTVAISGTPSVAISGTPSVAISGTPTVQIGNTGVNPVLTRDVDRAAQEPVMMSNLLSLAAGVNSVTGSLVLTSPSLSQVQTVPVSKRVVAQFIAIEITVPTGQKPFLAMVSNLGNASMGQAIALGTPETIGAQDVYRASLPVLVFVQQNASVDAFFSRSATTGNATAIVTMTGYLIAVP